MNQARGKTQGFIQYCLCRSEILMQLISLSFPAHPQNLLQVIWGPSRADFWVYMGLYEVEEIKVKACCTIRRKGAFLLLPFGVRKPYDCKSARDLPVAPNPLFTHHCYRLKKQQQIFCVSLQLISLSLLSFPLPFLTV